MFGLKYKIPLLTLLPLFFILAAISGLAIYNKSNTERQLLLDRFNSYRTMLESGDINFDSLRDKNKLEILFNEKIEFAKIVREDYSVIYTTEFSVSSPVMGQEKKDIDDAFQGIETIAKIKSNGNSILVIFSPLIVNDRIVATIHLALSNVKSGQRVHQYAIEIFSLMVLGMITCYTLIAILLNRVVLKNIYKLKQATMKMQKGNLETKAEVETKDEIGELAASFNQMVVDLKHTTTSIDNLNKEIIVRKNAEKALKQAKTEADKANVNLNNEIIERKQKEKKLREVQEDLIEASHRAGMAEVATDILHNVGNVLNSINISTSFINDTLKNSEVPNLKKVADMIQEHQQNLNTFLTQDTKGRHVLPYLIKAGNLLVNEHEDILDEIGVLSENVDHIKSIIKMQQEYAKVSGVEIHTTLDQVIEDAIRIHQADLERHQIRIVRDFDDLGEVSIDKQQVIQILVNLIGNAKHALKSNEPSNRILRIRSYRQDEKYLRIEVIDNGMGIPKDNLTKIFRHGFTTKKEGHGFGLHSSALAAKEMKGSLTVQSEGEGRGATFTLKLHVSLKHKE